MGRLDADGRQALVADNLRLAYKLARLNRYRRWGLDPDDLEQEAVLGLCRAAQAFDPETHPGVPFSAFARVYITGGMWRAIAQHITESAHDRLPDDLPDSADDGKADALSIEVAHAIDELGSDDAEVLVLRFGIDGAAPLGLLELADHLDVCPRTATARLARARENLARVLRSRGWTVSKAKQAYDIGRKLA